VDDKVYCDSCGNEIEEDDLHLAPDPTNSRRVLNLCGNCYADGPERPGEEESVRY